MRPPAHVPTHLAAAPFTVYGARAAALGSARLRASDFAGAGRLLYLPAGWEFELRGLARALPPRRRAAGYRTRISTPARTWLDLARILPLPDLVAVGDQLVRRRRSRAWR
ncbi:MULTISPECIES: hypothetical protein [unclassified Arthrobacter]|uniref:hypothetical protein n=1 Tax=unclassified Arthrobacter TaxID=235627 RepID=UPI002E0FA995|nr:MULTISPECIES: hypothetical protein [unclassified Arthrobacter]